MTTKFAPDCGARCRQLAAGRADTDETKQELVQCAIDHARAEILAEIAKIDAVLLTATPAANRGALASTEQP